VSLLFLAAVVTAQPYGTLSDGRPVREYTIRGERGLVVRFLNYGGIVTAIEAPDRQGRRANVVLGFGNIVDYEAKNANYRFGAIVGRYAGRIADARFTVGGQEVRLQANDGPHALHGGAPGFDSRIWRVEPIRGGAVLRYTSPAGEQNFPGRLDIAVTYRIAGNALRIDYEARTDAPTHLNLTNHSYFNLAGAGSGSVLDHRLQLRSDRVLETDATGRPGAGGFAVAGTPFDFRRAAPLRVCTSVRHPQLDGRRGCNHSWLLPADGRLRRAARLTDPASGRVMDVLTTEPSLHVYTANWIPGTDAGAQGIVYRAHDAVALEAQHLPDSPNRPDFPSTLLRPGQVFRSTTIYRFAVVRD
jgi:aldose 1-epimerase